MLLASARCLMRKAGHDNGPTQCYSLFAPRCEQPCAPHDAATPTPKSISTDDVSMNALEPITDPIAEWAWLRARCDLPRLGERVSKGQVGAYRLGDDAAVVMAVNFTKDTGKLALWVMSLGGTIGWRPKANLKLMETALTDCMEIASASKCKAIRIEPGDRPDWKLRLLPRFGFETLDVDGVTIMQKDVMNG